jgi:disulfide oxidoreductase YuzD
MNSMHPVAFKKAMIEAYLAGASVMYCGCYEKPTRKEAREWFDNEFGLITSDSNCDCCEDDEEDGDS